MNAQQGKKPTHRFMWLWIIPLGLAAMALLTVGGFAFAASQEAHDPFCASCHTQPETTFVSRSNGQRPVDLASYHTTQKVACIDCHSGVGLPGRLQAELEGAANAFKWVSGTAVQPAKFHGVYPDANCTKCHQNVTQRGFTPKEQISVPGANPSRGERGRGREREEEGRGNHWHEFLSRWQARVPDAGKCTSCHSGHTTSGTAPTGFMSSQQVQAVCDSCHRVLDRD